MYESKDKMVSHPDHYQSANGLEVIDCIEAFTAGLDGIEATDTGNIIKYACRWKKKNGIQDLEKILWYTQHLIDHLRNKEAENCKSQKGYMLPFEFILECDAKEALDNLMDMAKEDGYVTVADVYDVSDLSDWVVARDLSIGWSYDDIAATEIYGAVDMFGAKALSLKRLYDLYGNDKKHSYSYRLRMPCEPYDVKYKCCKECKEAESDRISEDSIPTIEDFKKWFNDELQKRGYVMEADICAHAKNCKAFDKKEDK